MFFSAVLIFRCYIDLGAACWSLTCWRQKLLICTLPGASTADAHDVFAGWVSRRWFCPAFFYCCTFTKISRVMVLDIYSLLFGYFFLHIYTLESFVSDSVIWVTITNSYSTPSRPPPLFSSSQHVVQSADGEALLKMTCLASMEKSFFLSCFGGAVGCCSRAFSKQPLKVSLPDNHHDRDVVRKMSHCMVLSPTDSKGFTVGGINWRTFGR